MIEPVWGGAWGYFCMYVVGMAPYNTVFAKWYVSDCKVSGREL